MTTPVNPPRAVAEENERIFNAGAAAVVNPTEQTNAFAVKKYPQNLGDHEYPHYVMFFIHVRKSDISAMEVPPKIANVQFNTSQNNTLPKTGQAANAAQVFQFGAVGASLGSRINQGLLSQQVGRADSSPVDARKFSVFRGIAGLTGGLAGAAVGAGAGLALAGADILPDRTQVLLKDAIALYLPGAPSATYNAHWDVEDMGILGAGSQQITDALNNSSSGVDKLLSLLKNAGQGAVQSFVMKQARDINVLGSNVGAFTESATGQVANPFKAQLFKNMDFRTFSFDYTFLPKNEQEYRDVQDIIKTFKLYMHPTLGKEKFILDYPAEFTLGFYHRDKLNTNLFKVSNCALTNMKIEYGGTDLTTFRDLPGAPSEISIKLTFVELEALSRERIEAGY